MVHGRVVDEFPLIIPTGTIDIEEEPHQYIVQEYDDGTTHTITTYTLSKAPVERVEEVTGTVDGLTVTFTEGVDYEVIDDNGDGDVDSIDFGVGGDSPDDNTTFHVSYVAESVISRYGKSHDEEIENVDDSLDSAIDAHYVERASGDDLERVGAIFGELGRRRGRSDSEYRTLLKSIVQSFNGRGTKPGLKFAISAGLGVDIKNINIIEDFTQVGYTIRIENTNTNQISGVVNDLATLADPSGVELLSPPIIVLDGDTIRITQSGTTVSSSSVGLGGGTLTLDGNSKLQ